MRLDAGDIVLMAFPFSDQKGIKKRPALVLTDAAYHRKTMDFLAAFITSKHQHGPWSLPITDADLRSGSLIKDSWVRADKIASLEQELVTRRVGSLHDDALAAVRDRIRELIIDPVR